MSPIEQALHCLKAGQLVAIPTETVYGLGADADNPDAVARVYTAKNRPTHNPLIIHIACAEAMRNWAIEIPDNAWILAKACWPGPLTLILKRHPRVSNMITGQQETVALRVPNHPLTLSLLEHFGGGIVAPSANPYGYLSPTTAEHVRESLGDKVDYILDGGPCTIGIESTIVYLAGTQPIIVREGAFSASALSDLLKQKVISKTAIRNADLNASLETLQSPGSDHQHYAPRKPLYLYPRNDGDVVPNKEGFVHNNQDARHKALSYGVLSFSLRPEALENIPHVWIQMPNDPVEYARRLYDVLHQLDQSAIEAIFVEAVPQTEAWLAIQDRLQRAARPST